MRPLHLVSFIAVLCFSCVALFLVQRRVLRVKLSRFAGRATMSPHDLFTTFYEGLGFSEEDVVRILRQVASATEVPIGRLRPQDRFDHELAPVKGWEFDDGLAEITWLVGTEARKARDPRAPQIDTLDDLIRYVCRRKTVTSATSEASTSKP